VVELEITSMKIVLGALAVVALLIGAQSGFAQLGAPHTKNPQAAYQPGLKHGVDDAKNNCTSDCGAVYIFQPGKTFYFHTKEFIQGYGGLHTKTTVCNRCNLIMPQN
jgi:hypothetical protein